jgi:hypothetical protein
MSDGQHRWTPEIARQRRDQGRGRRSALHERERGFFGRRTHWRMRAFDSCVENGEPIDAGFGIEKVDEIRQQDEPAL